MFLFGGLGGILEWASAMFRFFGIITEIHTRGLRGTLWEKLIVVVIQIGE